MKTRFLQPQVLGPWYSWTSDHRYFIDEYNNVFIQHNEANE